MLLEAGAKLLPNACGMCAGYGERLLGENVSCISSTARNFKGRMGPPARRSTSDRPIRWPPRR